MSEIRLQHAEGNDVFEHAYNVSQKISNELHKSVYLKEDERLALMSALATGGHVLMDSTYGTGKTTTAKAFAAAIGGTNGRIQGTPDVMASDMTGQSIYNQKTTEFDFREGPVFSNVLLYDEIDRSSPKAQAGMVQAMEEDQVTTDRGETLDLPEPFIVIATRNPEGQDVAAVLRDRFVVGVQTSAQTAEDRRHILAKKKTGHIPKRVVSTDDILELQDAVEYEVEVPEHVEDRANEFVDMIYAHDGIDHLESIQGGFRGFYNILNVAKYAALARGDRVAELEDVAFATKAVLGHRLVPTFDQMHEHADKTQAAIVKQILDSTIAAHYAA